jgi:Thrombospondin type 3 repeat
MKNLIITSLVLMLFSCNKQPKNETSQKEKFEIEVDNYAPPIGFNKIARMTDEEIAIQARRGGGGRDKDGDGIPNGQDNCPNTFNPLQEDVDKDGIGNACDPSNDSDFDTVPDEKDNCPTRYNPLQEDCNNNGIGDICDFTPCVPNTGEDDLILYYDFDGDIVDDGAWVGYAGGQPFYCAPSGLNELEIAQVLTEVRKDFQAYKINVTTDSALWARTPWNKRQKVIVTATNEWYGNAGGVAYINIFTSNTLDAPAFVFSKALSYVPKYIWEASSHEAGHALGLRHQSVWDANCVLVSSYNPGCCGEAPIMGVSYSQPIGRWWVGTSFSCTTIQNDTTVIRLQAGLR